MLVRAGCAPVAIVLLLCSCVTAPGIERRVIERSKREAPRWSEMKANTLADQEGKLALVAVKSHVLDLPLGIKQVQLSALTASQNAIHESVVKEVRAAALQAGIAVKNQGDLDQRVMRAVRKIHGTSAQIADIYYEQVEERESEKDRAALYYQIFVLVNFSKEKLPSIVNELCQNLKQAKDADLHRLADAMKGRSIPTFEIPNT